MVYISSLHYVAFFVGTLVGAVGISIIFIGCIRGLYLFICRVFRKDILISDIRIDLGHYLALGLEFLVAKDIIETIVEPTWDDLGKLAVIIALRTFLTLFLGHEVKEVREELEEERAIRKLKRSIFRKRKEEEAK